MRLIPTLSLLSLISGSIASNSTQHAAIEADLLHGQNKPIRGVRKMSNDEGQKFFLDYWFYHDGDDTQLLGGNVTDHDNRGIKARPYPYRPAIPVDLMQERRLFQRDFQCPAGTHGCTSIDRPTRCCGGGETCELVQDTGSGDVGCCPQGQECSGVIGSCQDGYTACSASLGGGCCIPGYECVSGGCASVSTITVTLHSTVMLSTTTHTVPAGSSTLFPSKTTTDSTGDLAPPARPTSLSTETTSHSSEATGSVCPVGFYGCSAVYHGGCCRTGRDCDTTSCPTTSSTTITSNDQTIVIPVDQTASTATATGETGQCASGWFSCADTVGGGCCPTGFACGSSCTASGSVSATATVAKNGAESAAAATSGMKKGEKLLGVSLLAMVVIGVGW